MIIPLFNENNFQTSFVYNNVDYSLVFLWNPIFITHEAKIQRKGFFEITIKGIKLKLVESEDLLFAYKNTQNLPKGKLSFSKKNPLVTSSIYPNKVADDYIMKIE